MTTSSRTFAPAAVLAGCCLGMMAIGFAANAPALCLVSIASDLGLDDAWSGIFLGCAPAGLVVSLLLAGPIADRIGFRVLLVLGSLLQASGLVVVSIAREPAAAMLGATITGLAMGIVDAVATPLACAAYPTLRNRVANALHAFFPVGTVVVAVLILLLMRSAWTWREAYRLVAVLCLPYGAAFLFLRLPERSHEGPVRLQTRRLIRMGPFVLLLAAMVFAGMTELGPSQWLPAYVQKAAGGSPAAGALGLILLGAMMTAGRLGNSWLSGRFEPKRLMIAGAALCTVSLVLAALPMPMPFTVVCLGALGLGVAGLWPTTLALAGNRFPQAGASMYSTLHAAGNLGCVIGPLMVGFVAEGWGLRGAMASLAVAPVAVIVVLKLLNRERRVL